MFGAPSGIAQDPAEADRLQRQQQVALQTSKEKEEELQSLLQRLSKRWNQRAGSTDPCWTIRAIRKSYGRDGKNCIIKH